MLQWLLICEVFRALSRIAANNETVNVTSPTHDVRWDEFNSTRKTVEVGSREGTASKTGGSLRHRPRGIDAPARQEK